MSSSSGESGPDAHDHNHGHDHGLSRESYFITANDIDKMSHWEQTVVVTYYMFTTISTVGLGDYHPKSDFERLICTFILVTGVTIFSMIMGNFIEIIESFRSFNDDLDRGQELMRFFLVLTKLNHYRPLHDNFQRTIEKYFDYRWINDRNMAVSQGQDLHFYN